MSWLNLVSALGVLAFPTIAWALGGFRRPVPWRTCAGATCLVLGGGAVVFLVPAARAALRVVNDGVVAVLAEGQAGAVFLFGPLAVGPGSTTAAGEPSIGFVLATQVLPAVVFFSALMALLYHLGLVQPIVRLFGRLFRRSLGLSGAESLAGACNLFFGVESAAAVRPFLAGMTRSELLTVLTCGMSTVASTTLAIYVLFLESSFSRIAGHLISASVLSIPAAAMISKLMLPETQPPETLGRVPPLAESRRDNAMAALTTGATDGVRLAVGIGALLVAVLGIYAVADLGLRAGTGRLLEEPFGFGRVFSLALTPAAWLLGIEPGDLGHVGRLLGTRVVLTEIPSYRELAQLAASGAVSPRTVLVTSYALCGFSHIASVGIFVGGLAALAPSRTDDLAGLGAKALVGSTLATLTTGAVAGLFYHGQSGILGL